MSHLVSIIMPAYNAEKYIAESIRSVSEQTYANWELIVVDDGSTDGTAEVARQFVESDRRIKYIFQQNGGQASARNRGIRNSGGDLIAFLDADDLWLSEKLELQVNKMEATNADVISTSGFVFGEEGIEVNEDALAIVPGRTEGAEMFKLLYAYNRLTIQSVLTRRNVLNRVQLLDESRAYQNCEDYDLWLSLAREGAVFYTLEDRLIRYRRHQTASTFKDSNVLRPMIAVMKKHSDHPSLNQKEVTLRLRNLYRNLLSALVKENDLEAARKCMKEFAGWDGGSPITRLQRVLLNVSPRHFNFVSRECLFRVEWHWHRVFGK